MKTYNEALKLIAKNIEMANSAPNDDIAEMYLDEVDGMVKMVAFLFSTEEKLLTRSKVCREAKALLNK